MTTTTLLITGGHVIDPTNKRDGRFDLLIERGKIAQVAPAISANGAKRLDATGQLVIPGLVDLHTHLRQPGREDKETIETGMHAAIRGGFTTICAMPNTEPAIDHRGVVDIRGLVVHRRVARGLEIDGRLIGERFRRRVADGPHRVAAHRVGVRHRVNRGG